MRVYHERNQNLSVRPVYRRELVEGLNQSKPEPTNPLQRLKLWRLT